MVFILMVMELSMQLRTLSSRYYAPFAILSIIPRVLFEIFNHIWMILIICLLLLPSLSFSVTYVVQCAPGCSLKCALPGTPECSVCLQNYFQRYNLSSKKCQCFQNHEPAPNIEVYCCPYHCKSCGVYGCTSCYENAYFFIDGASARVNCTCYQNYYQTFSSKYCLCRSEISPTQYYQDDEYDSACIKCPADCTCSVLGCISCPAESLRVVVNNSYNISTCYCPGDYQETYEQTCSCPLHCKCQLFKIVSCQEESHRNYVQGGWPCSTQYSINGDQCYCDFEYFRVFEKRNPYNQTQCLCLSSKRSELSGYYEYENDCRVCISGCLCGETGCFSCEASNNVTSINNVCTCINNFTYTIGRCECESPYYLSRQNQCACLSEKFPTKYYYSKQFQLCRPCPSGCNCTLEGCIQCQRGILREVRKDNNNIFICTCKSNSQQNWKQACRCSPPFVYDRGQDACVCDRAKINTIFLDTDSGLCITCPNGCSCDNTGCHSCKQQLLRVAGVNSLGKSTCHCIAGTTMNSLEYCVCPHPLRWNKVTAKCQCQYPYFINASLACVCSSVINSTGYFFDLRDSTCYQCPFNCICNGAGCVECSEDSLRFVMTMATNASHHVCPCKTWAFHIENKCLYCSLSAYYYSGRCVSCPQCLTCDKRGCLSCKPQTVLDNYTCKCQNNLLVNANGQCVCNEGYYHPVRNACLQCPTQCDQCKFVMDQSVTNRQLSCLSCPQQSHRIGHHCRCTDDYSEVFPIQKVCCPNECSACNYTDCFACNPYTNRVLEDGKCVCGPHMMLSINDVCICQGGRYLFDNECLPCILGCLKCYYDYASGTNLCTECMEDMNRNLSSPTCECEAGFEESGFIKMDFCVEINCYYEQEYCSKCFDPYQVQDGRCICPAGGYLKQNFCFLCPKRNGCLECWDYYHCKKCSQGYYLTFPRCIELTIFTSLQIQELSQTTLQFQMEDWIVNITKIQNILVQQLYEQIWLDGSFNEQLVFIEKYSYVINEQIVTFKMHIPFAYKTCMITIQGVFEDEDKVQLNHTFNVKTSLNQNYYELTSSESQMSEVIAVFSLIASSGIYVVGYKHNQLLFLLQTLCFSAFKINSSLLSNIYVLNQLKLVYYNFNTPLFQWLLPANYIEESRGNYHFTIADSNLLRSAGMAILFAVLVMFFLLLIIVSGSANIDFLIFCKMLKYSIFFFRFLEFMYKSTMYPLIFFAIQSIAHWNRSSFIQNSTILTCNIVSIGILIAYIVVTVIEYYSVTTSNFYKRVSIIEVSSCFICAVSLILLGDTYWIIPVGITILTRNLLYFLLRYVYLKDACTRNPFYYIPFVLELGLLILILFPILPSILLLSLAILVTVQFLISYFILKDYKRQKDYQKQKGFMEQSESSLSKRPLDELEQKSNLQHF